MTTQKALAKLKIFYVGNDFKNWFYPLEVKGKPHKLVSEKLGSYMTDFEIQARFNPSEVSITDFLETLKTLDKNTRGIFYIKDVNGVLCAVHVYWSDDGWCVRADTLGLSGWLDDRQVFSRNSLTPKTPDSSVPLTLCPHCGEPIKINLLK